MSLQSLETDFGSSTTFPDFLPKNSTFPGFFRRQKNRQSLRRRFASGSYADDQPKARIQTSNSEIFLFENFYKEVNENVEEERLPRSDEDVDLAENGLSGDFGLLNGADELSKENVELLKENVEPL